jgi:hypothetical protein
MRLLKSSQVTFFQLENRASQRELNSEFRSPFSSAASDSNAMMNGNLKVEN